MSRRAKVLTRLLHVREQKVKAAQGAKLSADARATAAAEHFMASRDARVQAEQEIGDTLVRIVGSEPESANPELRFATMAHALASSRETERAAASQEQVAWSAKEQAEQDANEAGRKYLKQRRRYDALDHITAKTVAAVMDLEAENEEEDLADLMNNRAQLP